jgi:peptidoglycan/xylan/chitin deacetylase (PgdA/CDA1 family)
MLDAFRPVVLCYHAVSDRWDHPLAVRQGQLERQVEHFLRRGYRPASWREVVPGRGRLLHVTFDDAYTNIDLVLPLLARLGLPCTVFACTDHADTGRPIDSELQRLQPPEVADELRTMDWDRLRAVAATGVVVGSHSVTHASLTQLSDADLAHELRDSREKIEAELAQPCRLLAYPYGDEDERVRTAARGAGYEAAFSMPGSVLKRDAYRLPRVGINRRDGVLRARMKTSPLSFPIRARRVRRANSQRATRP